jgi:GGDEF domain-containing protein
VAGVTTGLDALSASVGVAIFPLDGGSPGELVEAADAAAMDAKRAVRAARAAA